MGVESRVSEDKKDFTMSISGDFNFSMLSEFNKAYKDVATTENNIIIDLRNTLTVDSSALGMLLNLQKDLNKKDASIHIINSNKVIKNIFTITNFAKKFDID